MAGAESEECSKPIFKDGMFHNPWSTWKQPNLFDFAKCFFKNSKGKIPCEEELNRTLPIETPDLEAFSTSPKAGIRLLWIGHSTTLVQFDDVTILTDPVFSDRCSPVQYIGVKRYRHTPCKISDLPKINVVVISHNHYDHLDYNSVFQLNRKYGHDLRWYVPQGLASWMHRAGCENVKEMSWWEEDRLSGKADIKFVCTPCQHWCQRSVNDTNKVLWCSWSVIGPNHSFYFAGDTGYCEGFKQIGAKYGPFSLAAIPIGAFEPRWFMNPQHVSPKEAIQIHLDVKAQKSLGVHWGTFNLAFESYLEPKLRLTEELLAQNIAEDCFFTLHHGQVFLAKSENTAD